MTEHGLMHCSTLTKLCDIGFDSHEVYSAIRRYYALKSDPYDKMSFIDCLEKDGFLSLILRNAATTDLKFNEEGAAFVRLLMI